MSVFQVTPRILYGPGSIDSVGEEAARLGAGTALVFAGPNVSRAGHVARLIGSLDAAGVRAGLFTAIEPDPSVETAVEAGRAAREAGADLIIGIGGGSNLDTAKAASALAAHDVPVQSLFGADMIPGPCVDTILVPTTAGTGSEVTRIAVFSDREGGTKRVMASPYLYPAVAVLDPELTVSCPPRVTAGSGMDALVHAIEAYTSVNATRLTDLFAVRAMQLISANLIWAFKKGNDLAARAGMLEGSMLAGVAFGNAGVTATHALSYPVSGRYGIPHGIANAIMLPHVMEYNLEADHSRFALVGKHIGVICEGGTDRDAALLMVDSLHSLISELELPSTLGEYGGREPDIPAMALEVVANRRIMDNNPRPMSAADVEAVFRNAL